MLHESHPTAHRDPQLTETASTSWGGQDREGGEAAPLNTCCVVGKGLKRRRDALSPLPPRDLICPHCVQPSNTGLAY